MTVHREHARKPFGRLRACLLALSAGLLSAAPAAAQQVRPEFGRYAPAPAFDSSVTTSLYLPMRDGVRLAISISRPANNGVAAEGKFPVIFQHTLGIAGAGADGG